jgi:hypothetical protein
MFGWRVGEEAKIQFTITASRRRNWITLDRGACRSAEDVGLQLADAKRILGRLQRVLTTSARKPPLSGCQCSPRAYKKSPSDLGQLDPS